MAFSDSPLHLLTIEDAVTLKNGSLHSVAMALAIMVLHVKKKKKKKKDIKKKLTLISQMTETRIKYIIDNYLNMH